MLAVRRRRHLGEVRPPAHRRRVGPGRQAADAAAALAKAIYGRMFDAIVERLNSLICLADTAELAAAAGTGSFIGERPSTRVADRCSSFAMRIDPQLPEAHGHVRR